jgi:hypothetical protein
MDFLSDRVISLSGLCNPGVKRVLFIGKRETRDKDFFAPDCPEVWRIHQTSTVSTPSSDEIVLNLPVEAAMLKLPAHAFDCVFFSRQIASFLSPSRVLSALKKNITATGCIIMTVSNLLSWQTIQSIIEDHWIPAPTDEDDEVPLHFFTRKTITQLLTNCGYAITNIIPSPSPYAELPVPLFTQLESSGINAAVLKSESGISRYVMIAEPENNKYRNADAGVVMEIVDDIHKESLSHAKAGGYAAALQLIGNAIDIVKRCGNEAMNERLEKLESFEMKLKALQK